MFNMSLWEILNIIEMKAISFLLLISCKRNTINVFIIFCKYVYSRLKLKSLYSENVI